MTILSLTKRVDRLGPGTGGYLSFAEGLELVRERDKDRYRAWTAAGNTGRPPPRPPTPIEPWSQKANRAEARLWERLARGRARVAHDRCGPSSPFRDFTHIHAMSETELVPAVNRAEEIVHQAELAAWEAERSA